jgi:hypothetical protein
MEVENAYKIGNMKQRHHLGVLGGDGRIILTQISNKYEGADWMQLAQDGVKCKQLVQAIVNMVMNLRV